MPSASMCTSSAEDVVLPTQRAMTGRNTSSQAMTPTDDTTRSASTRRCARWKRASLAVPSLTAATTSSSAEAM